MSCMRLMLWSGAALLLLTGPAFAAPTYQLALQKAQQRFGPGATVAQRPIYSTKVTARQYGYDAFRVKGKGNAVVVVQKRADGSSVRGIFDLVRINTPYLGRTISPGGRPVGGDGVLLVVKNRKPDKLDISLAAYGPRSDLNFLMLDGKAQRSQTSVVLERMGRGGVAVPVVATRKRTRQQVGLTTVHY